MTFYVLLIAFDFNLPAFDFERAEFNSTNVEIYIFLSVHPIFNPLRGFKIGCASEIKINLNLFCISFGLHYL